MNKQPKPLKEIILTPKQRRKLEKEAKCPNCSSKNFQLILAEKVTSKKHSFPPMRKGRPIYKCVECGYWTDWFDGYNWHPEEVLKE